MFSRISDTIILFLGCLLVLYLLANHANANTGKALYSSRCTSCHNTNPTKPGSIGPDLAGSNLELIALKTQKREYPKGYKPKRKTRIMPRIPLTDKQLKDLFIYINSFVKKEKK